jgi:hypothetical protein
MEVSRLVNEPAASISNYIESIYLDFCNYCFFFFFFLIKTERRRHTAMPRLRSKENIYVDFKKYRVVLYAKFIRLRIGTEISEFCGEGGRKGY